MANRCYISTPFGQKQTETGDKINFDEINERLISPAVSLAGYEPLYLRNYVSNASIMDTTIGLISDSETMIADITTRNPNVIYELGIRHAFVPTGTLIIFGSSEYPLPFNLQNFFKHRYVYPCAEEFLPAEIDKMARALKALSADKTANFVYRKTRYARDYEKYRDSLEQFGTIAPYERSIFIMTKYPNADLRQQTDEDRKLQRIIALVQSAIEKRGFVGRLASDKRYQDTLWRNIEVYLLGCSKGVAIVENKYGPDVNPNVAMEWGWMRSAKKDVLYLLEKEFRNERADFTGFLSEAFSWDFPEENIEAAIGRWLPTPPAA
jgi:hypothetical protein